MESFTARYNDGISARTHDVRVRLTLDGLSVFSDVDRLLDSWPADAIRIVDPKSGDGLLRLAKAENDLARLTVPDAGVRSVILDRFPNAARRHTISMGSALRILSWSAAAVGGIALLIWIILPFAAEKVAAAIPMSWQSGVGEKVERQILGIVAVMEGKPEGTLTCTNEPGLAALAKMKRRLAAWAHPDIPLRVRVIDSKMINALALPGDRIVMTRGIINFVLGPNELAGILGHEIGHVASNHSLERVIKVSGISALFSLLVGDVAGGAIVIAVGEALITGQYSQAAEREADEHAVRLLHQGKFDSRPFAGFFDRLEAEQLVPKSGTQGSVWRWVATHPASGERTETIRRAARPGSEILSQVEWQSLKKICNK